MQVSKEPVRSKGVRLTPHVALPGLRLVHLPRVDHVGISHRITDEAERDRLRAAIDAVRPPGTGWIARTEAVGAAEADLRVEIEALAALWREVETRAASASAPSLVWRDVGPSGRAVRDLLAEGIDRIVGDSDAVLDEARAALGAPGDRPALERHAGPAPLLDAFAVPAALARALERRAPLPSGGHVAVDETEAFTAIDVNSGSHVAAAAAETIRAVNLEAADEIARQIRLRNLGGVVLVDFIDMDSEEHRCEVLERLRAAAACDPVRVFVVGWTSLGLVEMTRKRIRRSLSASFQTCCPRCGGLGRVPRGADESV